MATRFELALHGPNAVALRAAGEEALDEVERLEARLSLFCPGSEIARVNARADREPVRVTPEVFALLQHAKQLHEESGGAFDITIAPLLHCWGFLGGNGHLPEKADELERARACVGMSLVQLDPTQFTVRFARSGVMLDLGAIGKGYAVERAAEVLREAGVSSALLHGGTSSVQAIGHPPDAECWKIAIERPRTGRPSPPPPDAAPEPSSLPTLLAGVPLRDEAMSVSAVWGKGFEADGQFYGHVLDPRTGWPARGAVLAAVVLPSATEADALSTALLTVGVAGHESLANLRAGMRTLVVAKTGSGFHVEGRGIESRPI
ncbi:MAG TPA: FAD:protein FMN transferase [Candidatus Acidoferrum sp.]|nr:FAD:protein FMN transferase [Candidatus Acidoferrum sp.]